MKHITIENTLCLLLILLLSFTFKAWWGTYAGAFIASFFYSQKAFRSFLIGFFIGGVVWGGYSFYLSDLNSHILATKVTSLLSFSENWTLFVVIFLLGSILGGMGGLTGHFLNILNSPQKEKK